MKQPFTKMHGLGNDFVVFDATRQPLPLTPARIRTLADRHFGIGCDQVLLVEASDQPGVDFRYRIFNADGQEVEQCGNGARCFARFVHDRGLTDQPAIRVSTNTGIITLHLESDGQVTVDMGCPQRDPPAIPFLADAPADHYSLQVGAETLTVGVVSMGNPHVVLTVPDVATAPVARLGPLLETHPRFPNRVNVGFLSVVNREHIRLRVYERGVGETLACGTGACAAVVVGHLQHGLADTVQVDLPGGSLRIHWPGGTAPVYMTGPAVSVFEGWITL